MQRSFDVRVIFHNALANGQGKSNIIKLIGPYVLWQ